MASANGVIFGGWNSQGLCLEELDQLVQSNKKAKEVMEEPEIIEIVGVNSTMESKRSEADESMMNKEEHNPVQPMASWRLVSYKDLLLWVNERDKDHKKRSLSRGM